MNTLQSLKSRPGLWLAAAGVALVASTAMGQVPQRPKYVLMDVGTLGGAHSKAFDVNNAGIVVGWSTTEKMPNRNQHAFAWSVNGMVDLGTLGGAWSEAKAVNDIGQIVGVSETENGKRAGFYWFDGDLWNLNDTVDISRGQVMIDGTLQPCNAPLESILEATDIADTGVVIAHGRVVGDSEIHSFMLTPEFDPFGDAPVRYTYIDMGVLPESIDCFAYGSNEQGAAVGVSGGQAFMCYETKMWKLEHYALESQAYAVNNEGAVVGWTGESAMEPMGAVWRDGYRYDLGWQCDWISEANAINDEGYIVGWAAENMGSVEYAILWEGCVAQSLTEITAIPLAGPHTFFWDRLEQGTAISDTGQIAGFGRSDDQRVRAFVLTPIEWDGPTCQMPAWAQIAGKQLTAREGFLGPDECLEPQWFQLHRNTLTVREGRNNQGARHMDYKYLTGDELTVKEKDAKGNRK